MSLRVTVNWRLLLALAIRFRPAATPDGAANGRAASLGVAQQDRRRCPAPIAAPANRTGADRHSDLTADERERRILARSATCRRGRCSFHADILVKAVMVQPRVRVARHLDDLPRQDRSIGGVRRRLNDAMGTDRGQPGRLAEAQIALGPTQMSHSFLAAASAGSPVVRRRSGSKRHQGARRVRVQRNLRTEARAVRQGMGYSRRSVQRRRSSDCSARSGAS